MKVATCCHLLFGNVPKHILWKAEQSKARVEISIQKKIVIQNFFYMPSTKPHASHAVKGCWSIIILGESKDTFCKHMDLMGKPHKFVRFIIIMLVLASNFTAFQLLMLLCISRAQSFCISLIPFWKLVSQFLSNSFPFLLSPW